MLWLLRRTQSYRNIHRLTDGQTNSRTKYADRQTTRTYKNRQTDWQIYDYDDADYRIDNDDYYDDEDDYDYDDNDDYHDNDDDDDDGNDDDEYYNDDDDDDVVAVVELGGSIWWPDLRVSCINRSLRSSQAPWLNCWSPVDRRHIWYPRRRNAVCPLCHWWTQRHLPSFRVLFFSRVCVT